MNAYLFSAGVGKSQYDATRGYQSWDSCESIILYGGDAEQAQKKFEAWCCSSPEGANPVETIIKRVVGVQLIDQLLTESGSRNADWREISQQVTESVSAIAVDDFEKGNWVDVNQVLPPGKISFDIDSLQRELPEEIRSGLNWSPSKTSLFLVSALSPPPQPTEPVNEYEFGDSDPNEPAGDNAPGSQPELDAMIAALPEMREKEAAALVEARNSVVAGWRWRKFAADTPLAANEIQVSPCCYLVPVE